MSWRQLALGAWAGTVTGLRNDLGIFHYSSFDSWVFLYRFHKNLKVRSWGDDTLDVVGSHLGPHREHGEHTLTGGTISHVGQFFFDQSFLTEA